jgi:hypothetical protein
MCFSLFLQIKHQFFCVFILFIRFQNPRIEEALDSVRGKVSLSLLALAVMVPEDQNTAV